MFSVTITANMFLNNYVHITWQNKEEFESFLGTKGRGGAYLFNKTFPAGMVTKY
jgi:hypothetical protein